MPAWVTITLERVRAEAAVARIEAAVATDRAEIATYVETLRAGIVAEVRAKIASDPAHTLDADTDTVPPEFAGYVCLRILSRLLSRPGVGGRDDSPYRLTEDQVRELERAETNLDLVAEGKLSVSKPTTAATEDEVSSVQPSVATGGTSRRFTPSGLDGL